jgi:amino acid transporter
MIQRIQSLYLALMMILLTVSGLGLELFAYTDGSVRHAFGAFGITSYDAANKVTDQQFMPVFIGIIALVLLAFLCFMSYKNLARQLKLGRMIFFIYFLFVVSLVVLTIMGTSMIPEGEWKRELGLGFYLFVAGFPFSFLANTGIKRDKNLLDSLNRLR